MGNDPVPVLGIDLGTTNSVVATVQEGRVVFLADEYGQHRFPSVVTLASADTVWVGQKALAVGATIPSRMVYAAKRLMGRKFQDQVVQRACKLYHYAIAENPADGGVELRLDEFRKSPEDIASLVLAELKKLATVQFGFEPRQAVVTVPAYFGHAQREATQRAAGKAGLEVLRLLNEPTAAALSLQLGTEGERRIAVYDFGGGTFDVSIIRIHGKVYEVLGTHGDTFLGGDDIDSLLSLELARPFEEKTGLKLRSFPIALHRLRDAAENAKKELNHSERCSIFLPRLVADRSLTAELTRVRLDDLVRPLIARSLEICGMALKDAGLALADLTDLILVGGQTRMPLMRDMVQAHFGKKAVVGLNPDTSVADGAAREGAMLLQGDGALLLDVTPMTLGIKILNDRLYPLIARNTKIPVERDHVFTTHRAEQKQAKIVILQGDSEVASQNERLGEVVLDRLVGGERFSSKINVVFGIDTSGILHVKARDQLTGQERDLVIQSTFKPAPPPPPKAGEDASILPREEDNASAPMLFGPFSGSDLIDVVCFLHSNGKSGRLEVSSDGIRGRMTMVGGTITNAQAGDLRGAAAARALLAQTNGLYSFREGAPVDAPQDIREAFEALLPE